MYEVIEKVKALDPDIETVYVMSLVVGDILSFDKANHYSVEASNVNEHLVSKVHNAGKEIYVWTVNNRENASRLIALDVDNIITDDVLMVKDLFVQSKTSNVILEYIQFVESLF